LASFIPIAVDIHVDLLRGFTLIARQFIPFFECLLLHIVGVPFNIASEHVQPKVIVLLFLGALWPDVVVSCILSRSRSSLRLIRDAIKCPNIVAEVVGLYVVSNPLDLLRVFGVKVVQGRVLDERGLTLAYKFGLKVVGSKTHTIVREQKPLLVDSSHLVFGERLGSAEHSLSIKVLVLVLFFIGHSSYVFEVIEALPILGQFHLVVDFWKSLMVPGLGLKSLWGLLDGGQKFLRETGGLESREIVVVDVVGCK